MSKMRLDGRHLMVVAAMCGLAIATVGLTTNVAGLFFSPMADEFGVLKGAASLTLTISNICVAIGGLATRRLTKAMPWHVLILTCTAMLVASCAGIALAPSIGVIYVLCALRGLTGGIIGFVLVTYVLNKWFAAQLGLMTSIAMGSSGLAGAVFTPIIQPVITTFGWRAGQLVVAGLTLAFCLPAILAVPSADPLEVGLSPFGAALDNTTTKTGGPKPPVRVNRLVAAVVVLYAVLSAAVSAMPQHFPGFAEEVGLSVGVGAAMISASMVANTAGKVVMGWLCDRIGAKASIMAYTVLVGASIAALLLVHVSAAFVAAAFLFGLCYSRATVGLSMMCREVFGKRGFGVVYPVAALGCSLSNAVFSSAVGFAFDLTGGYTVSLAAFGAFLAGSAALVAWCYAHARDAVASARVLSRTRANGQ